MRGQPAVIVLNGVSSSGKSTLARQLQLVLEGSYLTFGVDTLLAALPSPPRPGLVDFSPDGVVTLGPDFQALEAGWYAGLAAMAGAGVGLILDEVFLGGAASQARLAAALAGLDPVWVSVTCDLAVATAREAARGDRVIGMAATQLPLVHEGVRYHLTVDTTREPAADCAARIASWLGERG